ncbi:DNA primase TraC [Caulifigura coniformis]|uniref:DNA primase TraC n=1 Tax=Caulifigura coniformis TaxID=2527983 RepID=A0A517SCL7_9PLAN|nr:zincin-like metallopeptidase domain-containing protein [Caulifigura coniformis]QDT53871.1 DNA primase TraC [Caulifigura coniformis]
METATTTREDIYTRITNQIIEKLEAGTRPWFQPWQVKHTAGSVTRPLRHNGERYQGVNVLSLWMSAELNGYTSPFWLTFQQARELKAHVKKGEKGSPVVYTSTFKKKDKDDAGEEIEEEIPFLKQYTVFNADQIEGLPAHFTATIPQAATTHERIEHAEAFFANTGADIRYGGNRAFYTIDEDYIRLPHFEAFRDAESHAATLAHELTHWTRHASRLNRDLGRKRFGDAGYAAEELVAELGSAFLSADLGITPEVREDHASYLECWLKVLKDDKRAIFTAASLATKAVEYLHGLQTRPAG